MLGYQRKTFPLSGDCFRACLVTLLRIPYEKIPPLEDMMDSPKWFHVFKIWINNCGYNFIGYTDDISVLETFRGVDGRVIVSGRSTEFFDHVVVFENGAFFHDPHYRPSDISPTGVYLIERLQ